MDYKSDLPIDLLPGEARILKIDFEPNLPYTLTPTNTCYSCDIFNDFNETFIIAEKTNNELDTCCYELIFQTGYECPLDSLPFFIEIPELSGVVYLDGDLMNDGASLPQPKPGKYIKKYKSISGAGQYSLGTICAESDSPDFTINVKIGEYNGDIFFWCNRKAEFMIECGQEPVDCCDGLDETLFTNEFTRGEEYCCNTFYFDLTSGFNNECFYGTNINISGRHFRSWMFENPINFDSFDADKPFMEICNDWSDKKSRPMDCSAVDSVHGPGVIRRTTFIEFLGKDGEIICKVPIDYYSCCIYTIDVTWIPDGLSDTDGDFDIDDIVDKRSVGNTYKITKNNFTLNPNPNNGEFELSFDLEEERELIISVHNSIGEVIYQIDNKAYSKGRNSERITLQNLNNGVYYLNIRDLDEVTTIPFVIRK